MGWLILAAVLGLLLFFCYRAWKVWETRFAHRHEFDPDYLALLMAQREEINGSDDAPARHSSSGTGRHNPPAADRGKTPGTAMNGISHEDAAKDAGTPGRRKPLLDSPAQEVYLRLRADMSGYPIMAAVDVAALITPVPSHLPRLQADFVVCKKDFSPVVAIFLERPQTSAATLDQVETVLRHHRIRVIRWLADELPSKEQMHAQIFKSKKN